LTAVTEIITPDLASQLDRLDLLARLLVEGFLTGLHRSPYHGFSAEFAEYRRYQPGEPVTNIDWRVLARSDRAYQKVFAEETNLRCTLLMDCSASMQFTGDQKKRPSKLAYGRILAACLAYLLLKQNDAVGLVTFDEKPCSACRPAPCAGSCSRSSRGSTRRPKGPEPGLGRCCTMWPSVSRAGGWSS